jgi:hypothetical protein
MASQNSCLGGSQYAYRDGQYGGRWPVASMGCRRATRFASTNCEKHKIQLGEGWVAFKSPSCNAALRPSVASTANPERFDETLDAVLRLTDPGAYSPQGDSWAQQAAAEVDAAIDALILEFLDSPYLHRREHSLHVSLCALLKNRGSLGERFPIGANLDFTQLVHKEWPETYARPEKGNRRGNFDVVVLSPRLLATCPTIEDFREGRLAPPFVIELGLDYGIRHIARDARKLINSRPYRGYLVHLTRGLPRDRDVEQIILNLQ